MKIQTRCVLVEPQRKVIPFERTYTNLFIAVAPLFGAVVGQYLLEKNDSLIGKTGEAARRALAARRDIHICLKFNLLMWGTYHAAEGYMNGDWVKCCLGCAQLAFLHLHLRWTQEKSSRN